MNKLLSFFLAGGLAAQAQSISITSPTASQTVSGFQGFSFSATVASAPSAYCVNWTIDAYSPVNSGCVPAPYTLPWNTFNVLNGTHTAGAVLYDGKGALVATATPVSFLIANTWPVSSAPGMTVATSTALNVNWSGTVTVTPAFTGAVSTHSKTNSLYVDGIGVAGDSNDTAVSFGIALDTTQFYDGPHVVALVSKPPPSDCPSYTDWVNKGCFMTEWSATVTFAQPSPVPVEIRADQREMFLAPGATHQVVPVLYNTDGSTTATTPVYNSENPSIATVSSGGLVTAVSAGGASQSSAAKIDIMGPTVTGTDLKCTPSFNCTNGVYSSASHPFTTGQSGQMITVGAATGWVAGNYIIQAVVGPNQITLSSCNANVCSSFSPGSASASAPTSFSTGPTRTAWALVTTTASPNPPIHHFGNDGSILSTYTPGKSMFTASMFQSSLGLPGQVSGVDIGSDQNYNPGFVHDYAAAGFTTLETGCPIQPSYTDTESNYQNTLTAQFNKYMTALGGSNLKWLFACDSWVKTDTGLFQTTRAVYSPLWTMQPLTHVLNTWNGALLQVEGGDEFSDYGAMPLEDPVTFANGITSIVTSSGICTVTGNFYLNDSGNFVISGSSITNMNSVAPATYHQSANTPPFHFTCTGVPDGTYGAGGTADPGLTIQPFAVRWQNNTNGSTTGGQNDYIHGDVWRTVKSQINAANLGRANWTFPQVSQAGCTATQNWANPFGGVADYGTKYFSGFTGNYLGARSGIHALLGVAAPTPGIGEPTRAFFGCLSPTAPMLLQNSSVATNYGFQGYQLTITSFSGNTLTFSTPHNLPNIIPGVSRLTLSSMSTPADNGNYYILATPTATTMTIANAVSDFTGTGTGGTLTFQPSGYTKTLAATNGIGASGTQYCNSVGTGLGTTCGSSFSYTGAIDPNIQRHRGETFTLSGVTGPSQLNTRTFIYNADNPTSSTTTGSNRYRELPQGSSTSGTATIIADNNFVPGRNGSIQSAQDPDMAFAGQAYCVILRCAGGRLYASAFYMQGYNPAGGFTGGVFNLNLVFGDTTITGQQLYVNPHWENYYSVPNFHALALATLMNQRIAPYSLTASLPAPDYGANFECAARTGAQGKMLVCLNITNAPQALTATLTPYFQTGQKIVQFIANSTSILLSTLNAGTSTATITVPMGGEVMFLFPINFAAELQQPLISANLSDVPTATKIAVRYGYDQYLLDTGNSVVDCGTGTCTLPVDRQIGAVFYRLIYLDTNAKVLAISDVQTL